MEQERISTYLPESDLPTGLEQKNVIIQRDRFGYGLTVSGDNPVYVLSVREGGAAHRAGINTNDQIIKVNGTRVTHCTHIDVVNLIKSGSYAQLTLLGQPKVNSPSTQKIIPADNQNGRVPLRSHTQIISIPERSNSTASTHSLQNTFDIKKAKESYERISKQLEKSKADLDRQRAKGSNHNQTKVSFIENQIRQYEQQLSEIKRRLDLIDSSIDTSPIKSNFSTENLGPFNESLSNRTSIVSRTDSSSFCFHCSNILCVHSFLIPTYIFP
jgi:Rho guanine nucleotide exchange factor 12